MSEGPGLSPRYSSGQDFAIRVGAVRFEFNARDFAARVGDAAARLRIVRREQLDADATEDLVALCAHGRIPAPRSPLAAHLDRHGDALLGYDDDLVHWLRRLVFRGAWIDQHVTDGRLEPLFEEGYGFRYRSTSTGHAVDDEAPVPDWSALAYREG